VRCIRVKLSLGQPSGSRFDLPTSYYPRGLLPLLPLSPSDKIVIFDDRLSPNSLILKSEGDLLPCAKVDISIKEAAYTNISVMFLRKEDQKNKRVEVFPSTAIRAISKEIRQWFGRRDVVVNKGNFAKPFVDYALAIEGQLKKLRGRTVLSFEHGAQDQKCKTEVHLGIGSFRYRTTRQGVARK
jgi:hypothetical protein